MGRKKYTQKKRRKINNEINTVQCKNNNVEISENKKRFGKKRGWVFGHQRRKGL